MNLMHLHFFQRHEPPIAGSAAQPVRYAACEWRCPDDDSMPKHEHPMNRFVCSWLTSDMAEVVRCDEALDAIEKIETQALTEWYADGEMFCVDFARNSVQFNQSNVGPEDTDWWNLPEARFTLSDVKFALQAWRDYLAQLTVA